MNIYLFLDNRLKKYYIPDKPGGSYSFYTKENNDSKLINIEERNGKWFLYTTPDSSVRENENVVESLELLDNKYYTIYQNNKEYLVFVSKVSSNSVVTYSYTDNITLKIGNSQECNIKQQMMPLIGILAIIKKENNNYIIEKNINLNESKYVYINNTAIEQKKIIRYGEEINIFGIRLMILKGIIIISNSQNIQIDELSSNIKRLNLESNEEEEDIEIKDIELYNEKNYFSKSPRLRRLIEIKKIQLTQPPPKNEEKELPILLTLGPMLTMGITSMVTLVDVSIKLNNNKTTWEESWTSVVSGIAMLATMLLWPIILNWYNKKVKERNRKKLVIKYNDYLKEKEKELKSEIELQKNILIENLIPLNKCIEIINTRGFGFWDKRIDQSDFLTVRIGIGDERLKVDIEYPEGGFTLEEDELQKQADKIVLDNEYIKNVPLSYSLYDNAVTAIMGVTEKKSVDFVNNIILQLLTFYSYEDLKIVVFTNEEKEYNWEYIKYLFHNFTNEKNFRFFSKNIEESKNLADYLNNIAKNRLSTSESGTFNYKPHYLIITDDYTMIKKYEFLNIIEECNVNLGFSLLILENRLSKLPSKCNNFISINNGKSGILKNSYEKQEQTEFQDEILSGVNMQDVAKILSNIPIEFENELFSLPNAISFLELEKVGKVEQLNILNRWKTCNTTNTLRAEIGIGEDGEMMYLDLHEKYHGPHGLIAGTTGSGKSEFIITYILSMCINYSPNDVSFIIIDYKGGGLALAFENKVTGIRLPHLAGTITNLDKAEMDRTLVSIDSEIKRRQRMFNEARDNLEEGTMDIYKYQKYYNEGRLNEPISHLFIICDEFAELKAQQPDFMDNLISVARIGRSLGVHLILATQKPSGVVNEQIWSNTKFRVCLKVQDESDSKEMLKKPDAAYITQAGRYYLQVGYDEIYALGQSGYCGAKYYPSDLVVKHVDKSINFINNNGLSVKSIQASTTQKVQADGEQLLAIMKNIIEISDSVDIKAKRLWLENIPEVILIDDIEKKYNVNFNESIISVIGEYDAPEKQEQGLVKYDYLEDGNLIIYGNDGGEREMFLNSLIYSSASHYTAEKINYYIIDYGSESLRKFQKLPQVGGMVFMGEDEKMENLLKMITTEIKNRKNLFADYGGEYINYIRNSGKTLPIQVVIFNNYDSINETYDYLYDMMPNLLRDSERYGIIFIITGGATNSVSSKILPNIKTTYCYKLKDSSDYQEALGVKTKITPRELFGRGVINIDGAHEFQTARIVDNEDELNEFITNFIKKQMELTSIKAKRIPILPEFVRFTDVESEINDLTNVPIGIIKNGLEIEKYDLRTNIFNTILSNKIVNCKIFTFSMLEVLRNIPNCNIIIIDSIKELMIDTNIYKNYYNNSFDQVITKLNEYFDELISNNQQLEGVMVIYGISKLLAKLDDQEIYNDLINKIKKYEKISLLIIEENNKLKAFQYDEWFNQNFSLDNAIWIGRGISESSCRLSTVTKEMGENIKNNMGYSVVDGMATRIKLLDFISNENEVDTNE